jgi:sulfoxide reductase heme-binding subunit YedZ
MTASVFVSHGTALWYLTRATGLVSLILLSGTVILGIISSVGWTAHRWPRFLSQAVHRNLSLFCLALIGIHIVTTVADGFVPIGYLDAFVPFLTPYRPLWIGLGALAFDMLLAVAITSGLRRRIGTRTWRGVHYLAYVCWPIAVLHGLGSGTDTRLPTMVLIEVVCIASVVGAVAWRIVAARGMPNVGRLATAGATMVVVIGIGVFAVAGPLRPGWSKRAGTSAALLTQIAAKFAAQSAGSPSGTSASPTVPSTTPPASTSALPAVPFTASVTGTVADVESEQCRRRHGPADLAGPRHQCPVGRPPERSRGQWRGVHDDEQRHLRHRARGGDGSRRIECPGHRERTGRKS